MLGRVVIMVAALLVAGCVQPVQQPSSTPPTDASTGVTTTDTPSPSGTPTPGTLRFRFNASYMVGADAKIELVNDDVIGYRYRTAYAACDISYFKPNGTKFLVPEGTHCDIANDAEVLPGQVVTLFVWHGLRECTKDTWGCSASATLPAGSYGLSGHFLAYKRAADDWKTGQWANATLVIA